MPSLTSTSAATSGPNICGAGARPDPYHDDSGGDYAASLPPPVIDAYQHTVTYQHAVTARPQLLIGNEPIRRLPPPAASSRRATRGFGKLIALAAALVVAAGISGAWVALNHPAWVDPPKADPPALHHPAKPVTRR
jgi:hypothetical protein